MELFAIAWRNVFRNPRRSLLNILAVAIGIMVILNMQAWIRGFSQTVYETQMDLDTAHVQVLPQGYEEEKKRSPLDLRIKDWTAVKDKLQGMKGLKAVGARIDTTGNFSDGVTSMPVMVRGVDPAGEEKLTILKESLTQGHYFQNDNDFIVGKGLADKLGLQVGQQVFLTALDQYGVRNLVDGKVGAIFASGYGLFDDSLVFITLKKAQDTLALEPTAATRVVLRFDNSGDSAAQAQRVRQTLGQAGFTGLETYEWKEFAQTVVSSIESRMRIMTFMLGILLLLVVIGILNSMSMAVQERYREIGTLRAIGMNRRLLVRLFLAEGFWIGLLGGLAGIVLGGGIGLIFYFNGLDPRGFLPKDLPIPFTTVMRPFFLPTDFVTVVALSSALAVLGSWLPARRAGKMSVRDALDSHG